MNTIDTEDRRKALDAFAAAEPRDQQMQVMPMDSGGIDRVFGAQRVAVYRDDQRVLQKLAALGAAAGDDWFYRFPVKSRDGSKSFIEGPSIKLANDLARIYGNCEVDTRVIDLGSSWLIYARFTDYESGFAMTRPFQQSKGGSKIGGKGDDADARRLDIAFQIGVSKAIRNVVTNALQTYSDYAFNAAKNSLVDKIGKDVGKWQTEIQTRLKDRGVDLQRVEFVVGRVAKDWTAPDIARIIAMMKAVADGMATLDETFPPKDRQVGGDVDKGGTSTEGAATAEASKQEPAAGSDLKTAQSAEAGKAAGVEATSNPATQSEPTAQAAPAPAGDKAAGVSVASDPAAKSADKPPESEAEYIAYATAWINAFTGDAAAAEARWKEDKNFRNKSHTSEEARKQLYKMLTDKIASLAK